MGLFALGQLLITPGAKEALQRLGIDGIDLFKRHHNGDWSEMDPADRRENTFSLDKSLGIFSAYTVQDTKFWVITEADRSATTILLPEEY